MTDSNLHTTQIDLLKVTHAVRRPVRIMRHRNSGALGLAFADDGEAALSLSTHEITGEVPALYPEWLGDRAFSELHGSRFPYVVGEMARGIATPEMVVCSARGGFVGFFGSAGLTPATIADACVRIRSELGVKCHTWGANIIHQPENAQAEQSVVDVLLEHGVTRASASAFTHLTPALVRYACTGLARRDDGSIERRNRLFAKISRPEMAALFMAPSPVELLDPLVSERRLDATEARIARSIPLAEDLTVEADSGGHTDNRPMLALLPTIVRLRDRTVARHRYQQGIRIGAAGGLGTPAAVASAFALGAAYVLTGSINQCTVESGLSSVGRMLLSQAELADVAMAPSADMFERGIKVQVLKRGTMFAARAASLYELYRTYPSINAIPSATLERLERDVFQAPVADIWAQTREHFLAYDPAMVERAESDPKHHMALVFRWYLSQASRWAALGDAQRTLDYQIWCGPAMGAFNDWVRGSFLEPPEQRSVAQIGLNLLEGAAVITRAHQLRSFGVPVPSAAFDFRPRPLTVA